MFQLRALVVAPVALALVLGACGGDAPASEGNDATPPRPSSGTNGQIHLLTYSFLQAHAEGVPCQPTDTPPLAAAAALKQQLLAEGDAALLVLAGDTTTQPLTIPRSRPGIALALARGDVILDAMAAAGVDLFVPGNGDIVGGVLPLLDKTKARGIRVLATNLAVEGRDDVLSHWIVEHEGIRLACLGAIPPRTAENKEYDKEPGVTIDSLVAVRRTARHLVDSGAADAVLLFSNLPAKINQGLCSAPDLHFILGSSEALPADNVVQRETTSLLNVRHQGRELAHTTIRIVDGNWGLVDLSPLYVLPGQVADEQRALEEYQSVLGTTNIEEIARRVSPGNEAEFLDKYTFMLENIRFLEEYRDYAGSALEHRAAELPVVGEPDAIGAILARQGPAIEAALQQLHGEPPTLDDTEVSALRPDECIRCHQEQYDFWASTGHSRAYELLEPTQRQHDSACLVCHAAGFGIRGGYNDPRLGAPFGGVTCMNCHSTYRPHVESRRLVVDSLYVKSDADLLGCVDCHSPRRSPEFDREAALPLVTCPPMRADDPILAEVRQGVLTAIERLREQGNAVDRDDYCAGKALVGLGRADEGFELLHRYASTNTSSAAIAIEVASEFEQHGRSQGALQILREFLQFTPSDLAANERYVELLVTATDPAARDPELALSHISLVLPPDTPLDEGQALPMRLIQVDAYYAAGREQEGKALLEALANTIADHEDILDRLVRYGLL